MDKVQRLQGNSFHPLLIKENSEQKSIWKFKFNLDLYKQLFLPEYQTVGQHVIPGAVYVELVSAIANHLFEISQEELICINNLKISKLLFLSSQSAIDCIVNVKQLSAHQDYCIEFLSRSDSEEYILNRAFDLSMVSAKQLQFENIDIDAEIGSCKFSYNIDNFYNQLQHFGVNLGPMFRLVSDIHYSMTSSYTCISDKNYAFEFAGYVFHPALIYCVFQLFTCFLARKSCDSNNRYLYLPGGLDAIYLQKTISKPCGFFIKFTGDQEVESYDLYLTDHQGKVVIKMQKFEVVKIDIYNLIQSLTKTINSDSYSGIDKVIREKILENLLAFSKSELSQHDRLVLMAAIIFLWATKVIKLEE